MSASQLRLPAKDIASLLEIIQSYCLNHESIETLKLISSIVLQQKYNCNAMTLRNGVSRAFKYLPDTDKKVDILINALMNNYVVPYPMKVGSDSFRLIMSYSPTYVQKEKDQKDSVGLMQKYNISNPLEDKDEFNKDDVLSFVEKFKLIDLGV